MATEDDAEGVADGVSKDSKARLTLIWDTNGTQDEHFLHPAKHVQISLFWCNETVHARGEKAAHIGGYLKSSADNAW